MHLVVVSAHPVAALARATCARAARWATVHVLDVDGSYVPTGDERALGLPEVGLDRRALHVVAARHGVQRLAEVLLPSAAAHVLEGLEAGEALLAVRPGVLLLGDPAPVVGHLPPGAVAAALRAPDGTSDGREPGDEALRADGVCSPHLVVLAGAAAGRWTTVWQAAEGDGRWLDAALLHDPVARVLRAPSTLVSPSGLGAARRLEADPTGGLRLDGDPVLAVDLSDLDPARPWSWGGPRDSRGRLSEHPALARLVAEVAETAVAGVGAPDDDLSTTSLGVPVDAALRRLYGRDEGAPDPFDPTGRATLLDWLTAASPEGGPGRYLTALRASRPDLVAAFPAVPGSDERRFRTWLERHAQADGVPQVVLDLALRAPWPVPPPSGRRARGVEVIGFLDGELGIGESARLVVQALDAAGVRHAEHAVTGHLASPRRPSTRAVADAPLDTAVLCVNADLTPRVADQVPHLLAGRYRIGMWYWEVEDFPSSQHGAFACVDEVWVATDFVRDAIAPHAPVPVVTMPPPLPQHVARDLPSRADLGLPTGPLLLFSFDHLSTLERKNPLGLLDAFGRAFAPGEGPTLVLKTLNARRRPADAERLRLAAARRPDVVLLEEYLEPAARDALVAACDAYVSLHRSEGLGLTMAEAMSVGKPVVATAYGGNLQFMTEANSFLVPWTRTAIGPGAEPYPATGSWAEPDLDAAAAALRSVVDDPDAARARGARAAEDIARHHTPAVAGAAMAARLAELGPATRLRRTGVRRLRGVARRVRDAGR